MASNNAMTTALALPSSKTNWTAIVPARAPPPPPPVKEIVGQCQCCECDVTTDQDYLKLKTGPGAGRIYCEEHVGWGECQKAWSGSCGCDVCADQEEQNECEICGATSDINDDWHGNSVCDECFMCCEECSNTKNPAVFEKTASDCASARRRTAMRSNNIRRFWRRHYDTRR